MQCKDIPTQPILEVIWAINRAGQWAVCDEAHTAFPSEVEGVSKLFWAKMRQLFQQGYLHGCPCGCRGDYVVSEKGCALIGKPWHGLDNYYG
jgi:hypothetical protein